MTPWIVGAIALVTTTAFLGLRMLGGGNGRGGEAPETPQVEAPSVVVPAEPLPGVPATPASVSGATGLVAGDSAGAPEAPKAAPGKTAARKNTPPPEAAKSAPAAARMPVAAEPQRVAAPLPRMGEPVRGDPLQNLNDALARCIREGILGRMSCEQRARSQYCGDFWGQIPQCPIGQSTDHGQ